MRDGGGKGNGRGIERGPGRGPGKGGGRGSRRGKRDAVLFPRSGLDYASAVRVLVCVDDTDDLTAATSTGYVAELLAGRACALGGEIELGITRHQLYLGPEVPYTSHNSAMCFACWLPDEAAADALREAAVGILASECADTADPGLCVWPCWPPPDDAPDDAPESDAERLVAFGCAAQVRLCTKGEAYALAESVPGLTLTEHGGTGDGVIGALAGLGLRLSGSDGRFRGTWDLARLLGVAGGTLPAETVASRLGELVAGEVRFVDAAGLELACDAPILLDVRAKPVHADFALTFPCLPDGGSFRPSEKVDLGGIGNGAWASACRRYEPDNDAEEQAPDRAPGCRNCLYRRWTERGFTCVAS